jgi:hypothetical protein
MHGPCEGILRLEDVAEELVAVLAKVDPDVLFAHVEVGVLAQEFLGVGVHFQDVYGGVLGAQERGLVAVGAREEAEPHHGPQLILEFRLESDVEPRNAEDLVAVRGPCAGIVHISAGEERIESSLKTAAKDMFPLISILLVSLLLVFVVTSAAWSDVVPKTAMTTSTRVIRFIRPSF